MKLVNFLKAVLNKSKLVIFSILVVTSISGAQINPWPWGKELPFPWTSIEGLWEGSVGDSQLLFSFEVLNPTRGLKQIRVLQVQPETLEIIASGVGVENKRIVRALMVGKDGVSYQVSVRLVRERKSNINSPAFTVLTLEAVNDNPEKFTTHVTLAKISNLPVEKYENNGRIQNSCSTSAK